MYYQVLVADAIWHCPEMRIANNLTKHYPMRDYIMLNKFATTFALSALLGAVSTTALADRAVKVENIIWAGDNIYGTVLTDTSFRKTRPGNTDMLYNFDMSGLSGQRPVAEAAPGDKDYNGGRWAVKIVTFTPQGIAAHDPDGDGMVNFELTNDDAVRHHEELGHITIMNTDVSFECPLIP